MAEAWSARAIAPKKFKYFHKVGVGQRFHVQRTANLHKQGLVPLVISLCSIDAIYDPTVDS